MNNWVNKGLLGVIFAFGAWTLEGQQVVELIPTFASQDDTVTVIFDATKGNAELVGVNQVYAHTGVITNLSATPGDWRHVQGNWGTDDPKVKMQMIAPNIHRLRYHIDSYYNVPAGETVEKLAFVFRNQDGTKVGREADGSDIYVDIYPPGFTAAITSHDDRQIIREAGDTVVIVGRSSDSANLKLFLDNSLIKSENSGIILRDTILLDDLGFGNHLIEFTADDASTVIADSLYLLKQGAPPLMNLPAGATEGITYTGDSSVYLQLRAPGYPFVYAVGDFSDWLLDENFQMNRTPDGKYYFIEIDDLDPDKDIRFQYFLGGENLWIPDPYCEMVLDPWNDPYIDSTVFPNMPPYPASRTNYHVGVLRIKEDPYAWDTTHNYQRPAQEQLVIYELLVRDFEEAHTYASVIERLAYLDSLGVNAIELMPVMEFEGNVSWGYNPSYFFAPDKYYGPKNELKRLVDSCHARGIAVILDVVMNHAFGQSPMVQMYFDPDAGQWGQPTADSPWFNEVPKHDFNVGYDFNHEAEATIYHFNKLLRHWVEEYRIDGYRIDLSKGLTQKNSLGNIGLWGQYDQSRIDILDGYKQEIRSVDSTAFVILEHFSENDEEMELSSLDFMLWGNLNYNYNQATMGYSSNLTAVSHQGRGWNEMHLVGCMETHDEERLMFRNLNYGNANTTYDTRELDTALNRMKLAATLFFTIPGPKMIWQFGEMGYDYSINTCEDGSVDPSCRLSPKPIRWDYLDDSRRSDLFSHYSDLVHLRETFPVFQDDSIEMSLHTLGKRIGLSVDTQNVVVLGNTHIDDWVLNPSFPHTGEWYEYYTGDTLWVNDPDTIFTFRPGEYRIYSDFALFENEVDTTPPVEPPSGEQFRFGPNPFDESIVFKFYLTERKNVEIRVFDLAGREVWRSTVKGDGPGFYELEWNGRMETGGRVTNGVYIYRTWGLKDEQSGRLLRW
jgi:glycosidase